TNRVLALPIFVVVMWLVYFLSIGSIGDWTVGFMNDTLFGEWIVPAVTVGLENFGTAPWLISLVADGILGGVGSVLGFVPQMVILFLLLSILEDCGYMARVAFIMDRLFRKFGLSGKSFIPMLVATGCGVPGIMASRTIEQDRDRKMTIMTTGFIPCGAKMPIVAMIAGALFGGSAWVATASYFMGMAAVVVSGLILKKTKPFAGNPAPFVMELPAYHAPVSGNILRATWERGWSFIKRAGTVILAASVIVWVLNSLSFQNGFHFITEANSGASILEILGSGIAWLFKPLGFGNWQAAVATVLGLVAKEEVVGVFGSLSSMANADLAFELVDTMNSEKLAIIGQEFFGGSALAGFSFLMFNLLCAPCFAAMGAIRREMNNPAWTFGTIAYMCIFAYSVSLMIYQFGLWFVGAGNLLGTIAAGLVLAVFVYLLARRDPHAQTTH
ncbi:MAG: ferrous iron transporter B, partial [Loktanella sp.]|nr:ferrous iron transporter B [Loktanella sp.]